jgi:flagellar biosynthesis/type III secretory pathway chaperone
MQTLWESEIADLLTDLSAVQDRSLEVLARKRELIVAGDMEGLADLGKEEEQVVEDLQGCLGRREQLLQQARHEGLPSDSLQSLAQALPEDSGTTLPERLRQTVLRARILQHHSLTNWVLVQRTLLHLSQMLEIVATGGKLKPTYGNDESSRLCGALVDREA